VGFGGPAGNVGREEPPSPLFVRANGQPGSAAGLRLVDFHQLTSGGWQINLTPAT
jgi:hypothetical protein